MASLWDALLKEKAKSAPQGIYQALMEQAPGAYGNNPMAVDTGGKPIPPPPEWINAITSGVDAAAKSPPAAARMYLGTLLGDKSDITEQSFRPDELAALNEAIKRALTDGRKHITYGDYDPSLSIESATGSVGPKILADIFNTQKSMAGVLGRANFKSMPDGSTVLNDEYDFGNMSGYVLKDGELSSVPDSYNGDMFSLFMDTLKSDGPYQALRVLGEVAASEEKGQGRHVNIRLQNR